MARGETNLPLIYVVLSVGRGRTTRAQWTTTYNTYYVEYVIPDPRGALGYVLRPRIGNSEIRLRRPRAPTFSPRGNTSAVDLQRDGSPTGACAVLLPRVSRDRLISTIRFTEMIRIIIRLKRIIRLITARTRFSDLRTDGCSTLRQRSPQQQLFPNLSFFRRFFYRTTGCKALPSHPLLSDFSFLFLNLKQQRG